LLPPDSFRVSLDRFKEFIAMDKDEQKQAKKDFTRLNKSTKQALSTQISGHQPCSCCAPKARTNKEQRRGANAQYRGTSRLIPRSNCANDIDASSASEGAFIWVRRNSVVRDTEFLRFGLTIHHI
jgi:hypothetical protein